MKLVRWREGRRTILARLEPGPLANLRALRALAAAVAVERVRRKGGKDRRRTLARANLPRTLARAVARELAAETALARRLGLRPASVIAEAERRYQSGERGKAGRPPTCLDKPRAVKGGARPALAPMPEIDRRPYVDR